MDVRSAPTPPDSAAGDATQATPAPRQPSIMGSARHTVGPALLQRKLARRAAARDAGIDSAGRPQFKRAKSEVAATSEESAIAQRGLTGPSVALPEAARIGDALGADLSAVRAHTGPAAAAACARLGVEAYTIGGQIAFKPGRRRGPISGGARSAVTSRAMLPTRGPT